MCSIEKHVKLNIALSDNVLTYDLVLFGDHAFLKSRDDYYNLSKTLNQWVDQHGTITENNYILFLAERFKEYILEDDYSRFAPVSMNNMDLDVSQISPTHGRKVDLEDTNFDLKTTCLDNDGDNVKRTKGT